MTTSRHTHNNPTLKPSNPFVTYRGPRDGYTIVHLTDGSTVGLEGDQSAMLSDSIHHRKGHVVVEVDGTRVMMNHEHIIGAYYTPKDV